MRQTEGARTTSWHSVLENKHITTTTKYIYCTSSLLQIFDLFRYSPTKRELIGRVGSQTTVVPVEETWK